jgi:hypothetical protein
VWYMTGRRMIADLLIRFRLSAGQDRTHGEVA